MENRKSYIRLIIVAAVVLAAAVFYFVFDPEESRFMPQCVFYHVTGLKCVGCGSQRMLHALLHGEIKEAFAANALAFISIPFVGFLVWLETQRTKRGEIYRKVYSTRLIWGTGIVMCLWFVFRNITGC